jgi:hypothetical protein
MVSRAAEVVADALRFAWAFAAVLALGGVVLAAALAAAYTLLSHAWW